MPKSNKTWFVCLKSIVYASLATLGVILIAAIVIVAVLMEIENQTIRNSATFVLLMIVYAIFLYRFHMHSRLDTYAEHTDKFDIKKELYSYIYTEGKFMFIIYGITTIAAELSYLIMPDISSNPILFATLFCLGPWMAMKIPVLRTVIAFVYSSSLVCALAVLKSRKIHRDKLSAKRIRSSLSR